MEITPGIHQIDGIRGVNCYLAIIESKMLVIDTGMPGSAKKIIKYIKDLDKNPSDISYIIITHADIDHIGGAAEIRKITGAKIAVHAGDAPVLSGKSGFKTVRGPFGVLFGLIMRLMPFHPVEPDVILGNDFEIDGFKVVHTPGHTEGSICLYQPGKIIFVGDALLSDSRGNPKPPSTKFSGNASQAKASLIAISELDFDVCLTGHGAPIVGSASAKLKNLLAHMK